MYHTLQDFSSWPPKWFCNPISTTSVTSFHGTGISMLGDMILGGLHMEMALWNSLGDLLEGSGRTTALTEAWSASSGLAGSFLTAAQLTHTPHAHQVMLMTLYNLQLNVFTLTAGHKDDVFFSKWRNYIVEEKSLEVQHRSLLWWWV